MREFIVLTVLAALTLPVRAADSRYVEYSSDGLMDLSHRMAICAGRQEAAAEGFNITEKPASAEIVRRVSKNFLQCAFYLRALHDSRELEFESQRGAKVDASMKEVEKEAEIAKLLSVSLVERGKPNQLVQHLSECRKLDDEVIACIAEQKQIVEEISLNRNQKATAPSQPETTPANPGRCAI